MKNLLFFLLILPIYNSIQHFSHFLNSFFKKILCKDDFFMTFYILHKIKGYNYFFLLLKIDCYILIKLMFLRSDIFYDRAAG